MPYKHYALRSILIAALSPAISVGLTSSAKPALMEQSLQAIRDRMARSPAPWPDAWQQEYVDTIRKAIMSHQDTAQHAVRLEILRKGFEQYWEGLKKSKDRSSFEVCRAQIRWYTEHLMGAKLLSEDERRKLSDQYKDIWNYAARSLLRQFPFLDPNTVHLAKAEHLSQCYLKIEAPLLPIYLCPLSEAHVGKIKQRWGDLRYARVDLWRRLGGEAIITIDEQQVKAGPEHPHYLLTKRSLAQLTAYIGRIVATAPEHYLSALRRRNETLKRRQQANVIALRNEEHLQKSRSRQIQQAEQISFLLKALLESPPCFDGSVSVNMQERQSSNHQNTTRKGGDAYGLKNDSPET